MGGEQIVVCSLPGPDMDFRGGKCRFMTKKDGERSCMIVTVRVCRLV